MGHSQSTKNVSGGGTAAQRKAEYQKEHPWPTKQPKHGKRIFDPVTWTWVKKGQQLPYLSDIVEKYYPDGFPDCKQPVKRKTKTILRGPKDRPKCRAWNCPLSYCPLDFGKPECNDQRDRLIWWRKL